MEVRKVFDKLKFSLFSPEMIRKMSAAKIIVPDTYDDDGYPIDGGLVDTRLGVVDPGLRCKTCGGRVKECPGHFGHIELVRPIMHVEFSKHIYYALKSTCPGCHKVLAKNLPREISKIEQVVEEVAESDAIAGAPAIKSEAAITAAASEAASTAAANPTPVLAAAEPVDAEKASKAAADVETLGRAKKDKGVRKCNHCGVDVPEIKFMKPSSIMRDKDSMLPTEDRIACCIIT
jgi:DNA-directed RNA polymerase beta' subunit